MPCVERLVEAGTDEVWGVLADGWLYPLWVVGAASIRQVDTTWPEVGSHLHHSFGVWPVLAHDSTEVLRVVPGSHLQLRARGWPLGEAHVDIRLTEGGPRRTRVQLCETLVRGPGRLLPGLVENPLISWRNRESLRRLAMLAEGGAERSRRHGSAASPSPDADPLWSSPESQS